MKKNRINLLVNREDYQKYEDFFEKVKLSVIFPALIFFIVFVYFYFLIKGKLDTFESKNLQKQAYLQQLTPRRGDEAKINYIEKKYLDLKTFMKEDASSAGYYQLLSDAIKDGSTNESSDSAILKSFQVNKGRQVTFSIIFSDFEKMMNFMKYVESRAFLDHFENISLKNFVVIGNRENKANYELSFDGKFIPIKLDLKS